MIKGLVFSAVAGLTAVASAGDAFRLYNIVPMYPGHEREQAARCVDYCERTGEDLALYCLTLHPEGMPARAKVDRYLASYRAFARALEGTKVRPGILVQAILGHWRRIDKKIEPWMRSVDHEGKDARFCPLDPDYAAYITYVFTEIARCDPAFIMTDDDVRAFVYGGTGAECFCERHVAKFNALRGTHHDSASLRKTIRACKQGDADYAAFHRLEREIVEDLVLGRARKAIDAVNPKTPGGACLSNSWALFGDFAAKRMNAKGQRPVLRLPTGCYYERLSADRWPATVLKMQRYLDYYRDSGVDLLDEADTCPHNLWSKTARAFYTHLAAAAFLGMRGAKVWFVNGIKETGSKVTEKYTDVLAEHRGQLEAIAAAVAGTKSVGLAAPCFTNAPSYHPTENCLGYFSEETDLEKCVYAFGIPVAASRDFGDRNLVFTLSTKAEVARLTDGEIRAILSGRALVLREAAVALDARGFAPLLGTTAKEEPLQFTCEYDLMNESYVRHTSSYAGSVRFTPAKDSRVLSEFRYKDSVTGENQTVSPAAVYAENELGGKVVTCGYHGGMLYLDVYSEERQRWFVSIVDLLTDASDRFTVCRETQDMLLCERRAADGTRYVLAMNMSSEPVADLRLRVPEGACVERLSASGEWMRGGPMPLGYYEAAVLRVR